MARYITLSEAKKKKRELIKEAKKLNKQFLRLGRKLETAAENLSEKKFNAGIGYKLQGIADEALDFYDEMKSAIEYI